LKATTFPAAQGTFHLDDRLAAEGHRLSRWALSSVLLMDDVNYPWLILVPERPGLCELHDLAPGDLMAMSDEIVRASRALKGLFRPDKINVAALGNQVPQLHVHVIARFAGDPAWPGPVWGAAPRKPYRAEALAERAAALKAAFSAC
jgi:diadenosine tetraphosphate (Ap4A) HIT family hydrolase